MSAGVLFRTCVARPSATALLIALVGALALAALALGPVTIAPDRVVAAAFGGGAPMDAAIVQQIRAPRLALGVVVGGALALSGAALQGILRNPLADPGLIGVTAGGAVGAVSVIVLGGALSLQTPEALRPYLLPAAAFLGAGLVIALLFALARRAGETSVATLILAGVAINAIAGAVIGLLIYVSDDRQLRELTFWSMGGLGAADWTVAGVTLILALAAAPLFFQMARSLDLMQLGERAAFHVGVDVERLKRRAALATALGVGAATAAAGPIGFVGLVAPHLARLTVGPSHRAMLPVAALYGVALVLVADLGVRLVAPPAEPPIGLATSLIGGPFFLWLLLRARRRILA
ncbi:iron ABC transporter permease [Pikeienuella sp. HZG-20]|uniref:FecCD family ABC transporter permease n=1 Tax=Paludibacillus litoralis TaxID=3133267 RepID=UPI0030EC9166